MTNKVQKLKKTEGIRNIRDEPLSEPSSGSTKKQNDTTNKTKLTFVGGGVKVSARIKQLQEENKTVCVMGSGRCGTHNVKLVKSVKSKKISCVEPGGGVGWKYVDVTCLVCPSKAKISAGFGMATDLTGGGARKKRKVLQGETLNSIDQSEASSESENSTSRR